MKYKVCNIKGFEGLYYIYEDGSIYSVRKKKMLKPSLNTNTNILYAYWYVVLCGVSKQQLRTGLHRIVAHHWIKPIIGIDTKLEVNHIDMDKTNNHYSNLEITTHRLNILHARQGKKWDPGRSGFKHKDSTIDKMSKAKMKRVLLYNDNEQIIKESIDEAADYLNTYRKKVERYKSKYKTIQGFNIKYLD